MFWECSAVASFWKLVSTTLSDMLGTVIPCTPAVMLLNNLQIPFPLKNVFLVGLTAAKKMLALRWQPPHTLTRKHWLNTFFDLTVLETSVARMHGASERTVLQWTEASNMIKVLLDT